MATETNAAPAADTTSAPAEKPSKMARARILRNELIQAEADKTLPEGKSVRQEFIRRAIIEIDLTKNGAITYYNNLKNEAAGKQLYIKPAKKTVGDVQGQEDGEKKELTEEEKAGDAAADAALTGQADDTPADDSVEEEQEEGKAE